MTPVALVRRVALAAMVLASGLAPALAGDFAERQIIGFSADGARFAFEEYGREGDTGFPYASIHIIDTDTDTPVPGAPIDVVIKDETAGIAKARAEVATLAAPFLAGIDTPGTLLASNPVTESGRDPHTVSFKRRPPLLKLGPDQTVRIEKILVPAPPGYNGPKSFGFGFRLVLIANGKATVLHVDQDIPSNRRVAIDYRVNDVVVLQPADKPAVMAVIVMVVSKGAEGPDGRYVGVAERLPD